MTTKAWYNSNGVRGSLGVIVVGLMIGLSGLVGTFRDKDIQVPVTFDTVGQVQEMVEAEKGNADELVTSAIMLIGGVMSLWGRIHAATKVTWGKEKP